MGSDRIMPERLFFGYSGQSMIHGLYKDYSVDQRPLAPGERRLGMFIVPPFQRGLVWTVEQRVRLIESLYMGLPIGALVWNQTRFMSPCDRWLLDGQQRVTAILGFMEGQFKVAGWRYPELPEIERRHFNRLGVAVIETQIDDEAGCRDIYDRLVYGGTPH
jgi:hypothetical protein